jgi:hypothetical protein
MKTSLIIAAAMAAALISPAAAEMVAYKAQLAGASEVPPNNSAGTGTAQVNVDTEKKEVSWTITFSGLSGDATAAHFHGPAAAGENAGPAIDISGKIESGTSPLTDAQLADLEAGRLYINIHTAQFPDGEIRGQVEK